MQNEGKCYTKCISDFDMETRSKSGSLVLSLVHLLVHFGGNDFMIQLQTGRYKTKTYKIIGHLWQHIQNKGKCYTKCISNFDIVTRSKSGSLVLSSVHLSVHFGGNDSKIEPKTKRYKTKTY